MDLITIAKNNIEANWKGSFTIPTARLYPFQWMWDSGFTSMGIALYDLEKAMTEIRTMFSGQWENGMLPHILFHSENETTYFPNYDFWMSNVNDGAPSHPKSSGITQPAVFGFVLEEIYLQHKNNPEVILFIKEIYPKVLAYHRFLYEYRDPHNEGLFFIYHPWETGRDNSPLWDESMDRIVIDPDTIPAYTRRDTQIANAEERPTSDQYDKYVYLLELGKKYKYDGPEIAEHSPVLIQDSMMNAILIKSNESLLNLARALDLDSTYLDQKQDLSIKTFKEKLWNQDLESFVCFDMRGNHQIAHKEIGGFISLFAGLASNEQAKVQADYLWSLHHRGYYLCPSFDVDSPLFDSKRYWRGPVWPQMNWMIYKGLLRYGYMNLANIVKNDLIELVSKLGFHEYFEAEKAKASTQDKGYGGPNFSWTSSCFLHLKLAE